MNRLGPTWSDDRACDEARASLHDLLDRDGDLATLSVDHPLVAHLAACDACREFASEHVEIHTALAQMPRFRMPEAAKSSIRRQTYGARRRISWRVSSSVAAALVVVAAGVTLWNSPAPPPATSDAEVARAVEDVRRVLGLAADGLERTQEAAVSRVIGDTVRPALHRVPLFQHRTLTASDRQSKEDT